MSTEAQFRVLLVGGPDVHLRLDLMDKLSTEFDVQAVGSTHALRKVFHSRSYQYHFYTLSRRLNVVADIWGVFQLIKILRKQKPDIVHTFATKPNIWGRLAAFLAGVPIVIGTIPGLGSLYAFDTPTTRLIRPLYEIVQRFICKHSTLTIFQNSDDLEQLVSAEVVHPEKAQIVHGSGVDTEQFDPSQVSVTSVESLKNELGIDNEQTVVTMISRITKSKGVMDFVNAAQQIKEHSPTVEFLLIGYADDSIDKLSREDIDKLNRHVIWPGPRNDIPTVLSASDIFVLPTAYREGIPRVLLEATSMALPVVTTRTPGCRDIVEHGVTGLVIEPGNVQELVSSIQQLIDAPNVRHQFGESAQRRTRKLFSLAAVSAETESIYKKLLYLSQHSNIRRADYSTHINALDNS